MRSRQASTSASLVRLRAAIRRAASAAESSFSSMTCMDVRSLDDLIDSQQ